jgi:hypothetical protein
LQRTVIRRSVRAAERGVAIVRSRAHDSSTCRR